MRSKWTFKNGIFFPTIFEGLPTETASKSSLRECCIYEKCGVKLRHWWYSSVWLRILIWLFGRFWEDMLSSADPGCIGLANWGVFVWLHGTLGNRPEFSNDNGYENLASRWVRMLSNKLRSREVSSSEISIDAHGELARDCIFSDGLYGEMVIKGLNETFQNFRNNLSNYLLRR